MKGLIKYRVNKIYRIIKYPIREAIFKITHFSLTLIPHRLKFTILNFAKVLYYRHTSMFYSKEYINRPKFVTNKVTFNIQTRPLVSIIIPTSDNFYGLKDCLEAIRKNTQYNNYEVILVDNNSRYKKGLEIIKESGHRVIGYPYKFNFSKINNFASKFANGDYLLFLNDDCLPRKNWLIPMLDECQKDNVGIVGSKLMYDNNTIQHVGVDFDAKILIFFHPYRYCQANTKEANYIREVLAVAAACLMIKKSLFEQAGGFDEDYWRECQDVDLCLKVKKLGFKIIYTPYSTLYHQEKTTRGATPEDVLLHDLTRLRKRWLSDYLVLNPAASIKSSSQKILLIKLLSMGDVIMVTSIIEAMRKKYPQSEIVFATSRQYKDIVEGNPYLNRVCLCRDYNPDEFDGQLSYYSAITLELLCKENWDLVYQLQVSDFPRYWLTDCHLSDLYADLANVMIKNEKMLIPITRQENSKIRMLLNAYVKNTEKIILLHTTSGWQLKDWDYQKYPRLIRKIKDEYKVKFFQIGQMNDMKIDDENIVHLEGKLTLKEIAALMGLSDLLICPDSGFMHMASAMGLATVALFGSTDLTRYGPINGNNYICIQSDTCCDSPCNTKTCYLRRDCTKDIAIETVFAAVNKILDRNENIRQSWWRNNIYTGLGR